MNSKEWRKWLFWFSFAVAVITVYKTIDNRSNNAIFYGNISCIYIIYAK